LVSVELLNWFRPVAKGGGGTSREKLIPRAPKMLIPGEFGFAGDLRADDNVLSLTNLHCAPRIKKLLLANFLYASGIKVIPDELETGSPGEKFKKSQKNLKF
jgi:hypothetical protein